MSLSSVRVFKVRPTAKLPHRAHNTDAGMDLFYCPQEEVAITIPPSCTALLQTGVKMQVPDTCMLQVMNKSGIASKKQLLAGACVVDEGYTGEIFVNLHNESENLGTDFYDAKLNKVKTVPYKHNYGYFFTSGPNTWHGMEKKEIKKERRCIQINYVTFETDWKVKS